MRLPGQCIIHGIVSDRSKINRPDQALSNRALTAYFLSPSILFSFLLVLLLLPFISFGNDLASLFAFSQRNRWACPGGGRVRMISRVGKSTTLHFSPFFSPTEPLEQMKESTDSTLFFCLVQAAYWRSLLYREGANTELNVNPCKVASSGLSDFDARLALEIKLSKDGRKA